MKQNRWIFSLLGAATLMSAASLVDAETEPVPGPAEAEPRYEEFFTEAALRVDLMHMGGPDLGSSEELFSLDAIVREVLWPGRRRALVDPTGFGRYRFSVFDTNTDRLIFSQGYATLFGEWLTTPEADRQRRSMHESLRFPFPRSAVRIVIEKRNQQGQMEELYTFGVEPADHFVSYERRYDYPVVDIHLSGDPTQTVDVLILGDGYTAAQMDKFRADARRFASSLLGREPYTSNSGRISIRAIEVPSRETGTDEPRKGIWRDTAFSCTFNTFDSARYLTTTDNRTLRDIASLAPYDTIFIMVNTARYGGGGIYNFYSVFSADSEYSEYVFIHEFGHGFGALGDEYYVTGATSYDLDEFHPLGVEPWEPNITAATTRESIPWRDLISADTPIPTPTTQEYAGRVGLFEGAGYREHGLYRACLDSIMLGRTSRDYCPVSERAITRVITWRANGGWQ